MSRVFSFPPLARPDATRLILGSMPGTASLQADQYYAHPRNAFWRIMDGLFGIPFDWGYERRCTALVEQGIAVWDVLKACDRPGSLDSNIDRSTLAANDFVGFFAAHPAIESLYFNGATAEQLFKRHVVSTLDTSSASIRTARLPSTSPAHAALSYEQKLERWKVIAS
ncbi:DNA-deoxyinosine glycosylase [Thiosocius teredinicola]|uniref:DNA-deoxyinosine glycosylase n=1 Tax=Thiosocius teredinicola TaxID=1973002 RepID=UPI000990E5F0